MRNRLISVLLAVLLVLPILPAGLLSSFAGTFTVSSGTTEMTDGNTYNVNSNVTVSSRITVSGSATLVLGEGATLTAEKGIEVAGGNTLTIRGTGTLNASGCKVGSVYTAAIGSGYYYGTINIEGGTVNATGTTYSAGIGGGSHSSSGSGTITISGGTVNATGGKNAAGIGGGSNHDWSGFYGASGSITITGGTVTAQGNGGGAGIGGGGSGSLGAGSNGVITITGGSVTATGGDKGYGIGPGVCTGNSSNNGSTNEVIFGAVESLRASSFGVSSVTIRNGTVLSDGTKGYTGTLNSAQLSSLAGRTLSVIDYQSEISSVIVNDAEYTVYTGFTATDGAEGYTNQNYTKLVDGSLNTKYCRPSSGPYIEFYRENGAFIPYGYIFTTGEDTKRYPGRNPKDWTVYGKVNENDSWTVLSTVSSDTVLQGINRSNFYFPIDYTGVNAPPREAYRYFRVEFTSVQSGGTFQLIEMRFYGNEPTGEFVAAHPATCTESGIAQDCYRRDFDGKYFADEACTQPLADEDVIIPAGHTLVYHAEVMPSSGQQGTAEYYECTVCGTLFADAACTTELQEIPSVDYATVTVDGKTYYLYTGYTHIDGTSGYNDQGPEKLVDNDKSSKFCTGTTTPYVEFSTSGDFVPYGYVLTTGDDTAQNPGRNPKSWVLKAKVNENDAWVTIAAVENDSVLQATNLTDYCFTIDYSGADAPDPARFRYYRFEVAAIRDGGTFQLSELQLFGRGQAVKFVTARPATCTEPGISVDCYMRTDGWFFSDEDATQQLNASDVVIPLAAHTPVYHAAVASTSTENGTIAHYECSVCHKYFADQACVNELTAAQIIDYRDVYYLNENGVSTVLGNYTPVSADTTRWDGGWYVVMDSVTVSRRIVVTGTVNLVLCDGKTLTAGEGISVTSGNAINIFAQSTTDGMGALAATGAAGFAAIGGDNGTGNAGSITIYGGRITANAGDRAAGIGGGLPGGTCTVTINGGIVTARGGSVRGFGGAGIGSGSGLDTSVTNTDVRVTINSGTVTATGGGYSAGIGGGSGVGGGEITITGGNVTATGGADRNYPGIGIGSGRGRYPIDGITINISGGVVSASGQGGAIGCYASTGGGISITGGKIDAYGNITSQRSTYYTYNFYFSLDFGTDSYLNCTGSIDAASYSMNGTYLIEKNNSAYKATEETITGGGKILRFNGSFNNVGFYDWNNTLLSSQTVASGYNAQKPAEEPVRMGYRFAYWKISGTNSAYDFNTPVNSALNLIAHYVALPEISYIDGAGSTVRTSTYSLINNENIDLNLPAGTYTIEDDVTVNGRIYLTGDTVLVLKNNKTLTLTGGIALSSNASLAICVQPLSGNDVHGTLDSRSYIAFTDNPASSSKMIAIYGGTVNAKGEHAGAAIGGISDASANVLIAGGTVTAIAEGNQGCGIGTGFAAVGGTVTITGGVIVADGDPNDSSTGIGSCDYGRGCAIVITGGVIYAAGYHTGPAIGMSSSGNTFSCSVSITGGQVTVGNNSIGGQQSASVTLGTTNDTDFIYSPAYYGSITFANELKLKGSVPETIATSSNIAGQTLIGADVQALTVSLYDEDGTTLLETFTLYPGDTVPAIDVPDKSEEGKCFAGWLKNGEIYDLNTPVFDSFSLIMQYITAQYLDESGTLVTLHEPFTVLTSDMTQWSSGWYVVQSDTTIGGRITVTGTVNLILCNNVVLTASQGITVRLNDAFNIYAQSTDSSMGALNIPDAPSEGAGIGGYGDDTFSVARDSSGAIAIYGGEITVKGGRYAAGIGGGCNFGGSNVTIAGGIVTVRGGSYAYAIGSGYSSSSVWSTIVIKGGVVNVLQTSGTTYGIGGVNATIVLGYTNADSDSIYSFNYSGTISYLNSMKIMGSDPIEIAGTDNIAGKTLVASGIPNVVVVFKESDGVTVLGTVEILPGGTLDPASAPAASTPDRYYFVEWRYNGSAFDFSMPLVEDVVLTAYYAPIPLPQGNGTQSDPYRIYTTEDWNMLADSVNIYGRNLEGAYIKLCGDDVTVTKMIGNSETPFAGTFDGDGRTLTLNIESTSQMAAPFSYVCGATIRNLRTAGTVKTTEYHASGLVGSANGVTIVNCRVSASILFGTSMTTVYSGSFIGHAMSAPFTMEGCLFDGTIGYNGATSKTMTNVGGLVGWDDASTPNIFNCVNKGSFANASAIAPIARVNGRGTITNCYCFVNTNCSGSNVDTRGATAYYVAFTGDVSFSASSAETYGTAGFTTYEKGVLIGDSFCLGAGETALIDLTYTGSYDDLPADARPYFTIDAGTLTQVSGSTYSLTMAEQNAEISFRIGLFRPVYIAEYDTTLGTVTADAENGEVGYLVTVTATGVDGILKSFSVTGEAFTGEPTKINDTQWTFMMPDSAVIVTVVFERHTLAGSGTQDDPYLIGSANDWIIFAQKVNAGQTAAHAKLTADITAGVDYMAGTPENAYAGVFDGNGYTIRFCKESHEEYAALFRHVSGATIKFLSVTGEISAYAKYAAGIVGHSANSRILSCRSSVTIDSRVVGDGTHGGLVAVCDGTLTVRNCRFDGRLLGADTTSCGGLVGWSNGSIRFYNNYYAPAEFTISESDFKTLARSYNDASTLLANVNNWYTTAVGTQNTNARGERTEAEMAAVLGNAWILLDGVAVPAVDMTNISYGTLNVNSTKVRYTGSPVSFTFSIELPDETVITEGLTVTSDPAPLRDIGVYTVTVTAEGYSGSLTTTVEIIEHDEALIHDGDEWYVLMQTGGTKHVYVDNVPDNFSFVLYDNGGPNGSYSNNIDATIVFHAANGAILTISGSGTLEGSNYDYLLVYDSDLSSHLGAQITGSFAFDERTTSGNILSVRFHTDYSKTYAGFALTVTVHLPQTALFGDVNVDGEVTVADVTCMLDRIASTVEYDALFDLNGDGQITVADVTSLLDHIASL